MVHSFWVYQFNSNSFNQYKFNKYTIYVVNCLFRHYIHVDFSLKTLLGIIHIIQIIISVGLCNKYTINELDQSSGKR